MSDEKLSGMEGINVNNETIKVEHASLTRTGESPYRSICPVCKEGVLLIRRNDQGRLERDDGCLLCGQRFRYIGKLGRHEVEEPLED